MEEAGKNHSSGRTKSSSPCPKGNRQVRRVLNLAANAAVKAKGTIFAIVYRRLVLRLGHAQAIGAIAHRLCRLIWKILHQFPPIRLQNIDEETNRSVIVVNDESDEFQLRHLHVS